MRWKLIGQLDSGACRTSMSCRARLCVPCVSIRRYANQPPGGDAG